MCFVDIEGLMHFVAKGLKTKIIYVITCALILLSYHYVYYPTYYNKYSYCLTGLPNPVFFSRGDRWMAEDAASPSTAASITKERHMSTVKQQY